jgi:hypothetical protein
MNTLIIPIPQKEMEEQISGMNARRVSRQQRKVARRERMAKKIDSWGQRTADRLYAVTNKINASSEKLKKNWFGKK